MEAEIKSEATGGRVNVETKDQKVWLPSLRRTSLSPGVQLLASGHGMKGGLGGHRGKRLRSVGSCPPTTPPHVKVSHDMVSRTDADGARSRAAAHEPSPL